MKKHCIGATHLRQGLDICNDQCFGDLTSDCGFLKALELVLRLKPLGLLHGGIPCCSFGFMSSPTHARTALEPWGNLLFSFVFVGNVCATRFALLALLAVVRKCVWMLEQPGRSALVHLPPIQLLLRLELRPRLVKWSGPQVFDASSHLLSSMVLATCISYVAIAI